MKLISLLKKFWKSNSLFYTFIVTTTIYFSIVFSPADFLSNPINNIKDFFIILSHWVVVFCATLGFIYLIAINKYLFAFLFPVFILLNSILAFFRFTANISLTPMLIDASLNNDLRSSLELVSVNLVLFVIINQTISLGIVYLRFNKIKLSLSLLHSAQSLAIILLFTTLIGPFARPVSERLPYITFFASKKHLEAREIVQKIRPSISNDAITTEDSLIVIVILGESLRSDHLSINGYERETTPKLKELDVISLPNIYSEYTYTDASIPYILSRADSINPEIAYSEPSFIGFFNKCDYQTTWIANQEPSNSYIFFINECKNVIYANMSKNNYNFDSWLDEAMFPYIDTTLKDLNPKQLIILHTIGSHWWYNSHFNEKYTKFKPIIISRVVSSCTKEEMINSYDNTILYTDFFISEVISKVAKKNAILFYLSDHGELLGEKGNWLHASEGEPLHRPASFIWMSDIYKSKNLDKVENLNVNSTKRYRTDFLFNSILDASNIQSKNFESKRSVFDRN